MQRKLAVSILVLSVAAGAALAPARAQDAIPGSAQAERVQTRPKPIIPNRIPTPMPAPRDRGAMAAPADAHETQIRIGKISVEDVHAFLPEQISAITAPYENKTIMLDVLWKIAADITELYRTHGYFLSRAYVPAQELADGSDVTIRVAEGKIGAIDTNGLLPQSKLIDSYLATLTAQSPISIKTLESVVLRLNDLPGVSVRAVLAPSAARREDETDLLLQKGEDEKHFSLEMNNYGSRYLGPYQAVLGARGSLIPLQNTQVFLSSSLPSDELKYGSIAQSGQLTQDISWQILASRVKAAPGFTLKARDLDSTSRELGASLTYQPIRQRQENLKIRVGVRGRNTSTTLLNTPFVEDHVRTAYVNTSYDVGDSWNGYNYFSAELTHGLSGFGASEAGELNLSRAEATPDFTRLNLSYARQQYLGSSFLAVSQIEGQIASGPLYSSEEFGYGGAQIGRGYDTSEISGDSGIAMAIEMRYLGFDLFQDAEVTPLAFYDIGRVWNYDDGEKPASGASAGVGVNFQYKTGLGAAISLAQPLTRTPGAPLTGNDHGPRLNLQISTAF